MVCIIYAFSLTLLLTPNAIAAEEAEIMDFSFNCKILDQQLLEIIDGKSSRYTGYKDGSKVGDTFTPALMSSRITAYTPNYI